MTRRHDHPRASAVRARESDTDNTMVTFSPDVVRGFSRLEAAVFGSDHFSPEILENLRDYTTGKPLPVQRAITGVAHVIRETMRHVNATGDKAAERALDNFISDLLGQTDTPPVTVFNAARRSR